MIATSVRSKLRGRLRFDGVICAYLYACSILTTTISPALAADEYSEYPVVTQVQASKFYSDTHGSVVDKEKLKESLAQIAPLRRFVTDASRNADSSNQAEQQYALGMLNKWAQGGAMLQQPSDFAGERERERFLIAINIITLKLKASGIKINGLLSWLGELNHAEIGFFGRRGRPDNLNCWSGVLAASYCLLSGDTTAKQYEDKVWNQSIQAIRSDGFIDTELARVGRAMLYHEYFLSALLTMHAFRKALGEPLTTEEHAAIKRLVVRVSEALCNDSAIAAASGGQTQEKIPVIQFSPAVAFGKGFVSGDSLFGRCGPESIPNSDPILGGDLNRTAQILDNWRR